MKYKTGLLLSLMHLFMGFLFLAGNFHDFVSQIVMCLNFVCAAIGFSIFAFVNA